VRFPVDKTFSILRRSKNESVREVLRSALKSTIPHVREKTAAAIVFRRTSSGHEDLIVHWDKLDPSQRSIVRAHSGRLPDTMSRIVIDADHELCGQACRVAIDINAYDLIPALVRAAEDKSHQHLTIVRSTLLTLAEQLQAEYGRPRDYKNQRDPLLVRRHVVAELEASIERYEKHGCHDIVEAFLILARRENATLRNVINNPLHSVFPAIRDSFRKSERKGVICLIIALLENRPIPNLALETLAEREDDEFAAQFAAVIPSFTPGAIKCMRRVHEFGLVRNPNCILKLSDEHQASVIQLLSSMGIRNKDAFGIYKLILATGTTSARRIAVKNLKNFPAAEATQLIVAALEDDDLEVQAIAVGQLRDRQVPNALALLLAKAESDSAAVRRVAQNNLKEFHFERFASVFETLAGDMRTSTGRLVRKADPEGIEKLNEELRSRSRFKRLRAVQMTVAMNAVTDVDKEIIERLSDDDQGVRIEAAKALALSKSQQAKRALRDALLDRSRAVQEAAEASLYALTHTIEKTEITP
jgi:hypothetical protein